MGRAGGRGGAARFATLSSRHVERISRRAYITLSDGVAGLEAELGQWNDGIKTEVRAQSPGEWAQAGAARLSRVAGRFPGPEHRQARPGFGTGEDGCGAWG